MPTLQINGAELFFETYGHRKEGQTPVLLMHGAPQTGRATWRTVALRLESQHFVIVPDLRGHGQSSNPNHTYTFSEHAADMAALVRALGFERAHVVGHSNGGNIAVVMLLEQPEVLQTLVIQAGNAWVSPDLKERMPRIFESGFIERERPLWARHLQELHGDRWRELVVLIANETIAQPNYAPEDLAKATRPVLVVQGSEDMPNAPMKHAEYMARHIPHAELWVPKGVGHSVHEEILNEWLARIPGFWARRGTDAGEALHRHKQAHHADDREGPFDLRVVDGKLEGTVLTEAMREESARVSGLSTEAVKVLLAAETPWALVNRPVDDLRRGQGILTERISQARLGEAARVLEAGPEWTKIRLEHDGYTGWIHSKALHVCSAEDVTAWRTSCNAIVTAGLADVQEACCDPIQKLVFATRVPVTREEGGWSWIRLPDGREWRLRTSNLISLDEAPRPDAAGIAKVLDWCKRFLGVPYLWGGRTPYGYDCSGLAGTFWACLGVDIARDADQQFAQGEAVEGALEPGDLVFFGEIPADPLPGPDDRGYVRHARITHVGISLGGDAFLHANGARWGISIQSFDPASPVFDTWLKENYRGARRYGRLA